MTIRPIARRGFTLVELMISIIIAAIVGTALVRMTLAQARFMDQQEGSRTARGVARGGINRLVSDLRLVEPTGGIVAAVAGGQDFTVRVPYAFGVLCQSLGTAATVSLLPVDSAMYNAPGHTGFAIRNSTTGLYSYFTSATANTVPGAGVPGNCINALPAGGGINGVNGFLPSVNGSPPGSVVALNATAALGAPDVGSIVLLYRTMRYEFKNSTALPGRTGLYRTMVSAPAGISSEELATPFANTARVNFYVLDNATAQPAVAAPLSNIRGFELVLNGQSERPPEGGSGYKAANLTTSVFFENRPD